MDRWGAHTRHTPQQQPQTQILPRELLPLSNTTASSSSSTALVPAGTATAASTTATPLTLLGLVKSLTEELRRKFGASAPGEEASKSREERALYKALTTLLMTLVTALTTTDGLLPRPGGPLPGAGPGQQAQRNALLAYILEEGGVNAAIAARQEFEREHKAAHAQGPVGAQAAPPTGEAERRVKEKEAAHRDAVGRVKEFLQRLRGEVEGQWANAGVQAVVLLAWGALLRDEDLGERLAYAGLDRWLAEARRDLLARAMGQGVFAFVEGALVHCWRRPQLQEQDAHMFFLDVTVELLSVYLRAPHEIMRSLPGYGRRPVAGPEMGMGMGMAPHMMHHAGAQAAAVAAQAAADASGQRKAAVEALISLVVRLSEAHPALAERLLWTRGGGGGGPSGGEDEPVQFVKDVSELVKHDAALRAGWIQLLAAMAAAPSEECKLSTVDFLTDYSPFADARRRPLDVLTYVLEDTRSRVEQNQPLQRDYLMGALAVIARVTCPALARDRELGFVPHVLPQLLALLNYPLPMEPKGALLKALAAFAALPDGACLCSGLGICVLWVAAAPSSSTYIHTYPLTHHQYPKFNPTLSNNRARPPAVGEPRGHAYPPGPRAPRAAAAGAGGGGDAAGVLPHHGGLRDAAGGAAPGGRAPRLGRGDWHARGGGGARGAALHRLSGGGRAPPHPRAPARGRGPALADRGYGAGGAGARPGALPARAGRRPPAEPGP